MLKQKLSAFFTKKRVFFISKVTSVSRLCWSSRACPCLFSSATDLIRDNSFVVYCQSTKHSGRVANTLGSFGLWRLYTTNFSQFVSSLFSELFAYALSKYLSYRYITFCITPLTAVDLFHTSAGTFSFSLARIEASSWSTTCDIGISWYFHWQYRNYVPCPIECKVKCSQLGKWPTSGGTWKRNWCFLNSLHGIFNQRPCYIRTETAKCVRGINRISQRYSMQKPEAFQR